MKQQYRNYLLNVGYQLVMYLFPLIISAYVSRVLGAENIGIYSYVNSIVSIFGMFGLLGIANYGNREIAKVRDNKKQLSKTFSSIFTLQLILSGSVFLIYFMLIFLLPLENKTIFLVQSLQLLSVTFDVSWFFFGLEKFKAPLARNFAVKVISFLLIVLLVKTPADLIIYTIILSVSAALSQLFLLFLTKREVDFQFSGIGHALSHLKQCAVLFIPVLAFSVYRIMDKTMLGAMGPKNQLGFYENAERIINIPIMIIGALGTVMMPHIAHTAQSAQDLSPDYKRILRFSMRLSCSIASFAALGLVVVGTDVAVTVFGNEYLSSGLLIAMLSCTILASAWSNVIRTHYFIPFGIDKPYVRSTIVAAIINLLCNAALIPRHGAFGACLGTIAAEYSIVIYQTAYVKTQLPIKDFLFDLVDSLLKSVFTMTAVFLVGTIIEQTLPKLMVQVCTAILLFIVLEKKLILYEFLGIWPKKSVR